MMTNPQQKNPKEKGIYYCPQRPSPIITPPSSNPSSYLPSPSPLPPYYPIIVKIPHFPPLHLPLFPLPVSPHVPNRSRRHSNRFLLGDRFLNRHNTRPIRLFSSPSCAPYRGPRVPQGRPSGKGGQRGQGHMLQVRCVLPHGCSLPR